MNIYESINSHLRVSDLVDEVKSFVDDPEAWENARPMERVSMVYDKCGEFVNKYKDTITPSQVDELLNILFNDNFHTELQILHDMFSREGLVD